MAAEGMGAQMQINFTRDQEYEADRVGMLYLARAGFDPLGMPNFFEAFYRRYGYSESNIPRMLVDHPVTSERIGEARNRAAQLERPKHIEDTVNFGLIQERLRVLTATDDFDLRGYYAGRLNTREPTQAAQYGQALALVQRKSCRRGHPLAPGAGHEEPGRHHAAHAAGSGADRAGQIKEGLATFERAEALFRATSRSRCTTARL